MARSAGVYGKDEVEQADSLPIGQIARWSGLRPGYSGTVRWLRGERETGSIGYYVRDAGAVVLQYRQAGQEVRYSVAVVYTTLASGGQRPWWRCPTCGRRCGVIYSCWRGGQYFVCRRCGDLAYASQHTRERKNEGMFAQLSRTRWGRDLLADFPAEQAREAEEAEARARAATAALPPVKRPRGRPRTKRTYTRRAPPTAG